MKEKAKERKTADRGRRSCAHSSGEGILDSDLGNGFVPEAQRGLSEIKNPLRVCNALITSEVTMNFVVGILGRI